MKCDLPEINDLETLENFKSKLKSCCKKLHIVHFHVCMCVCLYVFGEPQFSDFQYSYNDLHSQILVFASPTFLHRPVFSHIFTFRISAISVVPRNFTI